MLWITNYTPGYVEARLEALRKHVRCSTRCMVAVALGAVAIQVFLLNFTYKVCL